MLAGFFSVAFFAVQPVYSDPAPTASVRTWSSKSVWAGSWKIDAVDDSGAVLSSVEFTVQ